MSSIDKMRKRQREQGHEAVRGPLDTAGTPPPVAVTRLRDGQAVGQEDPSMAPPAEKVPAPAPKPRKAGRGRYGLPDGFTWPAGTILYKVRCGEPNLYEASATVPHCPLFAATCRGSIKVEGDLAIQYLKFIKAKDQSC